MEEVREEATGCEIRACHVRLFKEKAKQSKETDEKIDSGLSRSKN